MACLPFALFRLDRLLRQRACDLLPFRCLQGRALTATPAGLSPLPRAPLLWVRSAAGAAGRTGPTAVQAPQRGHTDRQSGRTAAPLQRPPTPPRGHQRAAPLAA